jgi:hypothetical protein
MTALAQQPIDAPDRTSSTPVAAAPSDRLPHPDERNFLKHLVLDQKAIWSSPPHLQPDDFKWLVPSAGIATGLFVTDPDGSFALAN